MKKIAVFLPVMPQRSFMSSIVDALTFLKPEFQCDFIDSYEIHGDVKNELYYPKWKERLQKKTYDAYLGFSFGGVILQQCFSILEPLNKPIVLFSTPTFTNEDLSSKLGEVIHLCKQHRVLEGVINLYQHALSPNPLPETSYELDDEAESGARLVHGLQKVLDTDSEDILLRTRIKYTHFIGAESALVNLTNVRMGVNGKLCVVPKAGMRVLQDNMDFCRPIILEQLRCEY
jgi:hypothetical protein